MAARMLTSLLALAATSSLTTAIKPPRNSRRPLGNATRVLSYNETTPTALYSDESRVVNWVSGDVDGQYIATSEDGDIVLKSIVTENTTVLVGADRVPSDYVDYWLAPDQQRILWAVNYTKQYRYTYLADYLVQDVSSGSVAPLVEDQVGDIQYAEFAPTGSTIALVRGNNLYVHKDGNISQITHDGGPDLFHAVPDWVYEEEILIDRKALWFSPDAEYVAFLSFNETDVGTFTIPYYMDDTKIAPSYPAELELRYPKVGTPNPTVQLQVLELATNNVRNVPIDAFEATNTILGEVAWVTDGHAAFIYRALNRVQDLDKHVLVNPVTGTSKVSRERDGTDGWLDNTMAITYVGARSKSDTNETYYVDASDESGWMHLYLYPVGGGTPIALTKGDWEVARMLGSDRTRRLIYYSAAQRHSTERHIYSVNYSTLEMKALVDDTIPAYWSADFSPGGKHYVLSYAGPDIPFQEVYSTNSTTPLRTLTSNAALAAAVSSLALPDITYLELQHPQGFSLNVMQRLPPRFDPAKKYPVLFTPYGGPGAQEVSKRFQDLDWRAYIASDDELEYIVYTVDNRGTGYKGRAFRAAITSRLGQLEAADQIWAAEQLIAQNAFIEADKVGMWGWSFGGYLTAKVLEADSDAFSFGLMTAPVTDWRFYDSMYTERYMKLLSTNEAGYNKSAVRNAAGFHHARGGFAITHGTGDDNVHYQNSAAMVDLLVGQGVSPTKMDVMSFPDSDHSIAYNGAEGWLYRFLTKKLWAEKERKGDLQQVVQAHQWGKRDECKDAQ